MPEVIELAPGARLRPCVDAYWQRAASAEPLEERILPDGCADIVFSDDGAMIVGTMTKPLLLRERRTPGFFGVRFRPGQAAAFLRMPMHEITDQRVEFRDAALAEQIANATGGAKVAAIEAWLARRAGEPDRRLARAVELLEGGWSVDAVAREVNFSRQHLRRRFLEQVGVGPKTFARVARFQRLLTRVRHDRPVDWAVEAAEAGYFDQSHLIAEFRDFAGTTPVPFLLSP